MKVTSGNEHPDYLNVHGISKIREPFFHRLSLFIVYVAFAFSIWFINSGSTTQKINKHMQKIVEIRRQMKQDSQTKYQPIVESIQSLYSMEDSLLFQNIELEIGK